ncbi:MAG: type II secretion system F family protein [Bdellovibrionales bacterium]
MDVLVSMIGPYVQNTWVIMIATMISVFISAFFGWEYVIDFVKATAWADKDEIKRKLDLIYVDVEEDKLSMFLIMASYGIGLVFFLIFLPNIVAGLVMGAVVTFAGLKVPIMVIDSLYQKRCEKVVDQMLDGMTIMANGTKAGNPPSVAMSRVIENIKGPLSQEFNLVKNKEHLGMSFEDALVEMSERVPMPDVQMFVMSVNILKETGGKIDQTFETINNVIRERQKLEKKISAMTAQGISQGIIITAIPFALLAFFWVSDREAVEPMFTTTTGLMILGAIFTLQIIGGLMIKKIVTIKV